MSRTVFEPLPGMSQAARCANVICLAGQVGFDEAGELVGTTAAIEVKATSRVSEMQLKGLRALAQEKTIKSLFLVSFDELDRRTEDDIRVLHWRTFLSEMWRDEFSW